MLAHGDNALEDEVPIAGFPAAVSGRKKTKPG